MKIAFLTLGCKLNYAETSTYERGFVAAGLTVVGPKQQADLYLINTCSVTATSDSKSRNLIRKVNRLNPQAKIIVTGCSAQLRREELEALPGVWKIFGCRQKAELVEVCLKELGYETGDCGRLVVPAMFGAYSSGERTRSFLKVQDGCDNKCKYCTVPFARGESRNIPICQCVKMAEEIAAAGIKEVVLTGVNTGSFGKSSGESFLDLLKALNEVQGIERYRISSIEPNLLTDDIIDWIAAGGSKFQPHFHIPLQTGCDELLEKMGRHYSTDFFARKIGYIRSKMGEDVFIGIDVMVGLPGESEELFGRTRKFLEELRPAFIHIFPYSRRPGTEAAAMPGQVSEEVKKRRVAELEELCARLHGEFVEAQKGKRMPVLFESKEKDGTMGGYSPNYVRVTRPWNKDWSGRIVEVEI